VARQVGLLNRIRFLFPPADYIPLVEITSVQWEFQSKEKVQSKDKDSTKDGDWVARKPSLGEKLIEFLEQWTGMDMDGNGTAGGVILPDFDPEVTEVHLIILTVDGGHNSGRAYVHRMPTDMAQTWLDSIIQGVHNAKRRRQQEELARHSTLSRCQNGCKMFYNSNAFQTAVALLIVFSFGNELAETQILPDVGSAQADLFMEIDLATTFFFTLELLLNIFAHSQNFYHEFVSHVSNWFDVFVVVISIFNAIFSASGKEVPGAKVVRLLRLGRVMRVFTAFKNLHKMVSAIEAAFVPVCNAFLLLLIITSVYAVLGTNFFRIRSPQYFGHFSTSLFTLFQVMFEGIAISRDVFEAEATEPGVAFYFVSYILISAMMLLNVVVAVLLEEFQNHVRRGKEKQRLGEELAAEKLKSKGCLDPVRFVRCVLLLTYRMCSLADIVNVFSICE